MSERSVIPSKWLEGQEEGESSQTARSPRQVPHFVEPGRSPATSPTNPAIALSQEAYANALDHLVITCVDIALVYETQIFLAKRRSYPRNSWWVIGGRMFPGESPVETAQRKLKQEAGLTITGDRLQFVGVYSTCFAKRAQPPQDHGSHTVNLTYQLHLTNNEQTILRLDAHEYQSDSGWFDRNQLHALLDQKDPLDQALLTLFADLQIA